MRRKLKNLKNKGGHSQNGAPRSLIDDATYRERASGKRYDSQYSGWSNASRPQDQAISIRARPSALPPIVPSVPTSGLELDLEADQSATVIGGVLTQWVDQSPNAFVFTPPGGSTGFAATADTFQNLSGYHVAGVTNTLSDAAATPVVEGAARTVSVVGRLDDSGNAISPIFTTGDNPPNTPICIGGGGFCMSGTATPQAPTLYLGSTFALVWEFTPGGAVSFFVNGWQMSALRAPAPLPTPPAPGDTATGPGVRLGNSSGLYWHGFVGQIVDYTGTLSAPNFLALSGNQANRFGIVGMKGWISDSAEIPFYGFGGGDSLLTQSESACRLFTTSTSGAITLFCQQTTGMGPEITNLPELTVFIDGEYDQTIVVPVNGTPFPAQPISLVSARLDGSPRLVEIWNGPAVQSGVASPSGTCLSGFQDPSGNTKIYPAVIPTSRIVTWGDSIVLGYGTSGGLYQGGFQLLRQAATAARISFWATSGRTVHLERQFDATLAATIDAIVTLLSEVIGQKLLYIEIGTNDWGASTYATPADWAADVVTVIQGVQTALPDVLVIWGAPIVRQGETIPNGSGWTLPELRAQAAVSAAGIGVPFDDLSLPLDGVGTVTLAEVNANDGTHPDNAGHAQLNLRVQKSIAVKQPSFVL